MPIYWVSEPSKTLMSAIVRTGLPIPTEPAPSRASVEVQWVNAIGGCSDIYALTDYAYIRRLANAIVGEGQLYYADHTESVIGSILTQLAP